MPCHRLVSSLALFVAPLALTLCPSVLHADTFTVSTLNAPWNSSIVGADNAGNYIFRTSGPSNCGGHSYSSSCYGYGNALTGALSYSKTAPTLGAGASYLVQNPQAANLGPSWTAEQFGSLISGIYWTSPFGGIKGVFDGLDPYHDKISDGTLDSGLITGDGSIFYLDGTNNQLKFAMDSSAAAPEPSTFVLLGSGLSGLGSLIRRRVRRTA